MTFETDYAIVIATLIDELKNLAPVFNQAKPQPIAPCTRDFSRALNKLQAVAGNSDCFIVLSSLVVIGRRNYFGVDFPAVI